MQAAITAIGTAVPPYKQDQNAAAELVASFLNLNPRDKKLLKALYKFTGIKSRNTVIGDVEKESGEFNFFPNDPAMDFPSTARRMKIYKDFALNLAMAAAKNCLNTIENFNKQSITHLITVSCTGMYAPGLDIELTQQLGLNSSTKRTAINFMGCYGAFNGIKVADAFCKAEAGAKVLVVCVELCTIHLQKKTHLDNLTSNAIFADGASAVLVQNKPDTNKYLSIDAFHCDLLPQTNQEMAWHITDSGFDILLSTYVPQAIGDGIETFFNNLRYKRKLSLDDIHYYAIHPGAQKILKACEKALNIDSEKNKYSYEILQNFGNMSSATVLFVLELIWKEIISKEQNEKNIFSCSFGPGLTLESMLLKTHYS